MPHPHRALFFVLASTSALLALLARVGLTGEIPGGGPAAGPVAGPSDGAGGLPSVGRVSSWLAAPLDGLLTVLAGTGPEPDRQRIVLLLLVVFCVAAWRGHRKTRLAYRPGPVDVHGFVDATPGHDAPVDDLKSQFCQRLSETHIYPPYAGPADPPPETFLDMAGGLDPRSGNPLVLVLQMLPRLRPKIGYRVTGVLQQRLQEPRYGVSVTVTSFLGGGRSAMTTQWGRTWEDATRRAAYWVLATILPVTRLARAAPWRDWRARELPVELFAAYDRGKDLQDRRHLDEALWHYGEALRLDPFNTDLRLMMASVQEEMGLFLDALDTYQGALVLRERGGWYDDHLWTTRTDRLRNPVRHLLGTLRHLRRRPGSITLRYQYARTLAYTERTVHQWFKRGATGEREKVRRQVRQRLEKAFVDRYWPAAVPFADQPGEPAAKDWLRRVLRESPEATAVMFQIAAAQELYRLREDAALARLVLRARPEVTHGTLLLLRDVWAPLRLAEAWHEWAASGWWPLRPEQPSVRPTSTGSAPVLPFDDGGGLAGWWRRGPRRRAGLLMRDWPCSGALLDRAVGTAQRRRWPRRALGSADFYHAACTYGFALRGYFPRISRAVPSCRPAVEPFPGVPDGTAAGTVGRPGGRRAGRPGGGRTAWRVIAGDSAGPDDSRWPPPGVRPPPQVGALADRAIERLRASLACTESGVAADRLRRWILSSDPDLAPLRRLPEFGYFEEEVYPNLRLVFPRPDKVINSRMSGYARELVRRGAEVLERDWRDRASVAGVVDPSRLVKWLDRDVDAWAALGRITTDHARYWRERAGFIRLLRETADPVQLAAADFPPEIPRFDDLALPGAELLVGDGTQPEVDVERLARLDITLVDESLELIGEVTRRAVADAGRLRRRLVGTQLRGGPLHGDEAREICAQQADRWRRVAERIRERETATVPDPAPVGLPTPG